MGLIDLTENKEKKFNENELLNAAKEMRALDIISIYAAKSGHPGGTLSIMDVTAALFLNIARLSPKEPKWEDRDRIFFSAGHKAPALYVALAKSGFYPNKEIVTLRKLNSPFQGHPHAPKLPGVEVSSGSLGQGLSIAVGSAYSGKMDQKKYRIFCIMGDGEQQEGSIWEAVMAAAQFKLDNLCCVIDKNQLQIDGLVKNVMAIDSIIDKYKAFGWNTIEIDGHNMGQILAAFSEAEKTKGIPTVIIANTIKGKGVSYMENIAGWHGISPKSEEQFWQALKDINCQTISNEDVKQYLQYADEFHKKQVEELQKQLPKYSDDFWWNKIKNLEVEMEPTRVGFGKCLANIGDDERIMTIHADISDSIKISEFEKNNPERKNRVISIGIAEQNMMTFAAGMALEGKIPITGTYGVFASGRPWDQLRTTICYDNLNVKIAGAHAGLSVGADGATHQALEEISLMSILPNMNLFVPCDSVETEKLSKMAILDINGPAYIRYAREATPVVTDQNTPIKLGMANIIRYREDRGKFLENFDISLAEDYHNENENICLIACGPMVPEAMRAAIILKKDYKLETRIINIHTLKPLDTDTITKAVTDIGVIVTCEEHQIGGFSGLVSQVINKYNKSHTPVSFDSIGVEDRFGESGGPWELMIKFELTAEYIVQKVLNLIKQ